MQAIPRDETEFILDADGLVVPAGLPESLDGYPVLAERFHYRQAVDVFDGRAGKSLLGPVSHRCGAGALPADAPQGKGGHQNTQERH